MKSDRNTWLARQIDSAKKSLEERPDWMKRAAHFEGSNTSSVGSADDDAISAKDQRKANDGINK